MGISTSISRFADYYRRHGSWETIRRAALALRRALFSSRMVLFYCDLSTQTLHRADLPSFLKVERKTSSAELSPEDLEAMTSFWNPKLAYRNMGERFDKGASLWLIKSEGKLAGYGWTLRGRTIEPHYFPPEEGDVHLFDFHVFPQYRGWGMNPFLVTHILRSLATEGAGRALIEAAEWNQAQLSSLSKTPFRFLGRARKLTIFGRTIVCWTEKETAQ
jgi:ribosomal protein S18 acetylase RimI-like enzyme